MPQVFIPERKTVIELPTGTALLAIEDEVNGAGCIPFGCRAGSCGACVIEILENGHGISPADETEVAFIEDLGFNRHRHRLACLCTIYADVTIRPSC